jgi:hypothetical protein
MSTEGNAMTDSNYTHISVVADRSGSMGWRTEQDGPVKAAVATDGIHEFVTEQRKIPGKTTFSLTDFDTEYTAVASFSDGTALLDWKCSPRNGTALLDATGYEITQLGEALEAMPEDERPGRVYVVIATDGQENSSHEYTLEQVREMITRQHDAYGWEFVFVGAGPEAWGGGTAMGIMAAAVLDASTVSMAASYSATSSAVSRSRTTGYPVGYNIKERESAREA